MPFVRGTKIQVSGKTSFNLDMVAWWNQHSQKTRDNLCVGDILTVSSRRGSGWIRARNERTHEVITLRNGPYIALVPGWMHPSRKRAEEARLSRVQAAHLIWEQQQRSVEPVTSSESLVERRGLKPLVCDTGKAKSSAINHDVQKVEPAMQAIKIKNMVDLSTEIKNLREDNLTMGWSLNGLLSANGYYGGSVPQEAVDMVENVVNKTIMALEKEIKQLREQNTVLLRWRNKHLESTSHDAWELVEDGPAKSCSCAVQRQIDLVFP